MSVRRATQLAAVLGVALVLVFGVFLWRESRAVATRVNDVRTVYDPSADQVALLDTALSDMQRGVSGFLIGAQEDDLEPYVNGSRRSALALQELRRLASRDAEANRLIAAIELDLQRWADESATPAVEARRADDVQSALAVVRDPASQALYTGIEADLARLRALVEARRSAIFDLLATQATRLTLSVVAVVGLLWGALMLGFLFSNRKVLAPLDDLRAQIGTATRVDNHAAIAGHGPPELRALAADVETMRRELVAQIDEARSAQQALDQKAPVVAAFRTELAPGPVVQEPGITVHGQLKPAEGVLAGDWWDTARLRATGELAIIVADISGHGAAAALAAIRLKQAIAFLLLRGYELTEMASALASLFKDQTWYATVLVVCIDPQDGAVRYINAGHPAGLLIDEHGEVLQRLERTALPLGVGRAADIGHARLGTGESILLFSDGLIESRGADGEELGEEQLQALLQQVPDDQRLPQDLVAWVLGAARQRATDWGNDDVTLVAVQRS